MGEARTVAFKGSLASSKFHSYGERLYSHRVRPRGMTSFPTVGGIVVLIGWSRASAAEPPLAWSAWNASPAPIDPTTLGPIERAALARCGPGETGLRETASAVVARKLRGLRMPELDQIALLQRAAGEPHPWARAWVATGRTLDSGATAAKLDAWLALTPHGALRRCGVASGTSADGTRAIAVVAIEAFADLAPLPTRARTGQWLTVEARLLVPATGGEVIVLGPSGCPRALPTSFDGAVMRARFAPEAPGEFSLQVMADVGAGRRPILEATVFVDVDPPAREDRIAPGEELVGDGPDDERLARMVTAARASMGLPPLARDARLDAVARDHAARMARANELAHELGDGDPLERLRAAGLDTAYAGENIAHASTLPLAHRSLWASPSHRANLLRREFQRVGIAVVRDERGDAWVVEMLAAR
jgi:hypothetical protein